MTGDVDVELVVKDIFDLVKSPAVQKQLEAQGQATPKIDEPSQEELDKVEGAIENLKVEANVDENDVLRRMALDAEFKVPESAKRRVTAGREALVRVPAQRCGQRRGDRGARGRPPALRAHLALRAPRAWASASRPRARSWPAGASRRPGTWPRRHKAEPPAGLPPGHLLLPGPPSRASPCTLKVPCSSPCSSTPVSQGLVVIEEADDALSHRAVGACRSPPRACRTGTCGGPA